MRVELLSLQAPGTHTSAVLQSVFIMFKWIDCQHINAHCTHIIAYTSCKHCLNFSHIFRDFWCQLNFGRMRACMYVIAFPNGVYRYNGPKMNAHSNRKWNKARVCVGWWVCARVTITSSISIARFETVEKLFWKQFRLHFLIDKLFAALLRTACHGWSFGHEFLEQLWCAYQQIFRN